MHPRTFPRGSVIGIYQQKYLISHVVYIKAKSVSKFGKKDRE